MNESFTKLPLSLNMHFCIPLCHVLSVAVKPVQSLSNYYELTQTPHVGWGPSLLSFSEGLLKITTSSSPHMSKNTPLRPSPAAFTSVSLVLTHTHPFRLRESCLQNHAQHSAVKITCQATDGTSPTKDTLAHPIYSPSFIFFGLCCALMEKIKQLSACKISHMEPTIPSWGFLIAKLISVASLYPRLYICMDPLAKLVHNFSLHSISHSFLSSVFLSHHQWGVRSPPLIQMHREQWLHWRLNCNEFSLYMSRMPSTSDLVSNILMRRRWETAVIGKEAEVCAESLSRINPEFVYHTSCFASCLSSFGLSGCERLSQYFAFLCTSLLSWLPEFQMHSLDLVVCRSRVAKIYYCNKKLLLWTI